MRLYDHLAGLARLARRACRAEVMAGLPAARTGDDFMARLTRLEGE
jgi:hypothetical protein